MLTIIGLILGALFVEGVAIAGFCVILVVVFKIMTPKGTPNPFDKQQGRRDNEQKGERRR